MITAMRRGATGWVAKILFALLIVSFGTWGIVDYLQPDPDPVVISVGDAEVRQSWMRTQFSAALEQLRQRIGSTVSRDLAMEMGLDDQVIDGVIDQQVLTREAQNLGLATTEEMLRSAIAQNPAFQGVTGQFDRGRYRQVLFRSGLTESQFLGDLNGRLLREPLVGAAAAAPPPPEPVFSTQFAFFAQQRTVSLMYKAHADLPPPDEPDDSVLRAFYQEADQAYSLPELRTLSAVILSPERVAQNLNVPENRIEEAYDNRTSQFRRPEERTISQLVFQDAEAAQNAAQRLRNGESWVSVAADSAGNATELGSQTKSDMVPEELAEPAFALAEPGFTDPIETPFGHHVLWVKAIDPAETQPLEDVRDQLRKTLALDMAIDVLIERAHEVEDTLASGASLEAAAEAAGMSVQKFEGVSQTGRTAAGERPDGLPEDRQFLNVAFQTGQGETSILTETQDGGYFVVRVDRVAESAKRPFEDIREQVLADWRESQRAEQAEAAAEKLAESVRAGTDIGTAAAEAGFTVADPAPFTRNQAPNPTTPDLVEAVFDARKGETIVFNGSDRVFVARVDDVSVPAARSDDEETQQLQDRLRQRLDRDRRQEIVRAFQNAVRADYDITIDRPAIERALR